MRPMVKLISVMTVLLLVLAMAVPRPEPKPPHIVGKTAGFRVVHLDKLQLIVDYLAYQKQEQEKVQRYWKAVDADNQRKKVQAAKIKRYNPPVSNNQKPISYGNSDAEFLACTRGHESDTAGGYRAVNSTGSYRGAYQFSQSTWNNTAAHAGRNDLIGVSPDQASPADQDALALSLYHWQGGAPWLNRC